jgi:hypothetical protein
LFFILAWQQILEFDFGCSVFSINLSVGSKNA